MIRSTGMRAFRAALLAVERSEESGLSARQLAILLEADPGLHGLSSLTLMIGASREAIIDDVTVLVSRGLLMQRRDPADRRNLCVERTLAGECLTMALGARLAEAAAESSAELLSSSGGADEDLVTPAEIISDPGV